MHKRVPGSRSGSQAAQHGKMEAKIQDQGEPCQSMEHEREATR